MTVEVETNLATAIGNGATTVFDYNFRIPDGGATNYYEVYLLELATADRTDLVEDVDFTIDGIGNENGGSVTYPLSGAPLASTHRIVIERIVSYTQELDIASTDGFNPEVVEAQLDLMVMQTQQVAERLERTPRVPVGTPEADYESLVGDIIRLADSADNIDTVADNISIVNTVATNIVDVQNAEENANTAAAAAVTATNAATTATEAAEEVEAYAEAVEDEFAGRVYRTVDTVATLLADTTLTYSAGQLFTVATGQFIQTRKENFSYEVAASGASNHHITTAGGVKLYVIPGPTGYDVRAFGAKGDGATDDTAAVNAAFAVLRAVTASAVFLKAGTITGAGKLYKCDGGVNATGIFGGDKGLRVQDLTILSNASGLVALDLSGSNNITWQNIYVGGLNQFDATLWPRVGVQLARTTTAAGECYGHTFINCGTDGFFQQAAYLNYAGELIRQYGCNWMNRGNPNTTGAGYDCYAGIMQASDHFPVTSEFQTVVTGVQSNTEQHYYGCRFHKPFGVPGPTCAFQGISNHHHHNSYFSNGEGAMIEWFLDAGATDYCCTLDIQSETTGSEAIISFIGDDPLRDHAVSDLRVRCGNLFASEFVIGAFGIQSVTLETFELTVTKMNYAGPPTSGFFANPNLFALRNARIALPSRTTLEFTKFIEFIGSFFDRENGKYYEVGAVHHVAENKSILADDTAITITPLETHGILEFFCSATNFGGQVNFRASASPAVTYSSVGSSVTTTTTTILTGTAGTDGRLNISIRDGAIDIENRAGFGVTVWWKLSYGN